MAYTPPPNPSPLNQDIHEARFIDFETVPKVKTFEKLDERGQALFVKKYDKELSQEIEAQELDNREDIDQLYDHFWRQKAALHAEFNKIVCASLGRIERSNNTLMIKAFTGTEEEILTDIAPHLAKAGFLVAHNGVGFDYPLLERKSWMLGLPVPGIVSTMGKKPWDVFLFDTMEMWKGISFGQSISLDALSYALGIESPKTDISGADVSDCFYRGEIERIATYCNGDIKVLATSYIKMIRARMFDDVVIA